MKLSSNAVIRKSDYSFNELLPVLNQVSKYFNTKEYEKIIDIVKNNNKIKDSLFISSPSFLNSCYNIDKFSNAKKRNLCLALYKYLIRMLYRATPFGSFSSIGKATLKTSELNQFSLVSVPDTKKHMSFSLELQEYYYYSLVENMEFIKQSDLLCKPNTCIRDTSNYFDYYLPDIDSDKREGNKILYQKNDILEFVYKKSFEGIYTISELISLTEEKFSNKYTEDVILALITELLREKFILLDIYPNVLSEKSLQILKKSAKLTVIDEIKKLIEISKGFSETEDIKALEKLNLYTNDIDKPNRFIINQEITNGSIVYMPKDKKRTIEKLAHFLVSNFNKSIPDSRRKIDIYKERFSEKYGHYRSVSLVEVFDEISGLGSPFSENLINDKQKYDERKWLNELKFEYSKNSAKHFDLSQFYKTDKISGKYGFDLNFNIYNIDGQMELTLGRSAYSRSPKSYHGRFGFLNLEENENYTHGLIYYPKNSKIKNLGVDEQNFYKSNLVINGIKRTTEDLTLSDVYLKLSKDNEFILHDIHGRILKIDIRSMVNLDLTNDYVKFIGFLNSKTDKIGSFIGILESLDEFHQKRIVFEDIVIIPEKWNIKKKMLTSYDLEGVQQLFHRYNIPEKVKIMIEDQVLVLDINKNIDVELLIDTLKKEDTIEVYESYGIYCKYTNCDSFSTELTFTFYDNKDKVIKLKPVLNIEDRFQIMDNNLGWFYVKLYTYKNLQDKLLSCINNYIENTDISWFFLRYSDERPHIRFRIYIDSESKFKLKDVFDFITKLMLNGVVNDYSICPYEREYERYGIKNYPLVEKIFEYDSRFCLDLLKKRTELSDLEFKYLIVFSSIKMFRSLLGKVNNYEFLFYEKGDSEDKKLLKSMIKLAESESFNLHNESLNILIELINSLYLENGENVLQLIDSLLHMHFNRLFGDLNIEAKYRNFILGVLNFETKSK